MITQENVLNNFDVDELATILRLADEYEDDMQTNLFSSREIETVHDYIKRLGDTSEENRKGMIASIQTKNVNLEDKYIFRDTDFNYYTTNDFKNCFDDEYLMNSIHLYLLNENNHDNEYLINLYEKVLAFVFDVLQNIK